jgi:myo-inositol-1(or 4)-monophosphatase
MCCDRSVTSSVGSPDNNAAELRSVAEQLAAEAAAFVRRRRSEVFGAPESGDTAAHGAVQAVRSKSTPTDPVTVVDTETEHLLRRRLAELRPGDPILGEEEGGPIGPGVSEGRITWVLDPIDGTVNFVYGIPAYAVSVAAQLDGVSVAGAVADVIAGEIYSAGRGLGAHVQGQSGRRALRCNGVDELSMALLGTGFGYSPARRTAQAALLARLLPVVRDMRRIGSAALDLCMVAAGRLDAHYEHGLNVWDWAAGALIAAEAGAWVQLPQSSEDILVAAAPGIANELHQVLDRAGGLAPLPE